MRNILKFFAAVLALANTPVIAQQYAYPNGIVVSGIGGYGAAPTFAVGVAAGTGATVACATNATCDNVSGTLTLIAGTSTTTGVLITITFGNVRVNHPNCVFNVNYGLVGGNNGSGTNTAVMLTGTAPTASQYYSITYFCGGY